MIKKIVIHGGGYVGLTAAMHYAKAGWKVLIYDPSATVVQSINTGKPRAENFLSYMSEGIQVLLDTGKLRATTDFQEVCEYTTHSIAVPTERAGVPCDDYVTTALYNICPKVTKPKFLIIIESTLTPGFIDSFLSKNVYRPGRDFYLAVCPRRDWFADKDKNLHTLERIVGGVTPECTKAALEVISTVSPNIRTTDYRTAELCKAVENALLHVQVMFGHQLAAALPDRNVAEALKLAGTHWRLTPIHLGFGTGGRCVPLGTEYLIRAASEFGGTYGELAIGQEAHDWDNSQRKIIATLAMKHTPKDGKILIMGAAYRPDFKDAGLSPGIAIAQDLHRRGVSVTVMDPLFSNKELEQLLGFPPNFPINYYYQFDTILLATPHSFYQRPPLTNGIADVQSKIQYILDAQGTWKSHETLFKERKITYRVVGEPGWMD